MKIKFSSLIAAAAFYLMPFAAFGQVATPSLPLVPLGYCQLTSIDASTLVSSCTIPTGANAMIFQPEAQAIRYRDDGTAPQATVGMPVAVGTSLYYAGSLSRVRVISQTAGAKLNVLFYKSP